MMRKSMGMILVWAVMFISNPGYGMDRTGVVVFPFDIYAAQDLSYLGKELPEIIGKYLEEDGAVLLTPGLAPDQIPSDAAGKRKAGANVGADYVIWGTMTWVGQQFSLDAKLTEVSGSGPPVVWSVEGVGVESVTGNLRQLTQEIGARIFQRVQISEIRVSGNERIEAEAIKRAIKTKVGDLYVPKKLTEDMGRIFDMGYFDDVRIESEDLADGKIVIIQVKEKATIRAIRFSGNTIYSDEEVSKNLTVRKGSILNFARLQENIERIENLYKEKNYHNVHVAYELDPDENNQVGVQFLIEEGGKVRIQHIIFSGNETYSEKELKKLMSTKEKGFFSWLTDSGELDRENLNRDVAVLTAFYQNSGYIHARVGNPEVEFKDEWIDVSIKIEEGPRFRVGNIDMEGDLVLSKEELLGKLKIQEEEFFNREVLRRDILMLSDLYSDEGYAYAEVGPRITENPEVQSVDITLQVRKGLRVYFESISISGNTKTRDKVIRRELKVHEQELYSGVLLKEGVRRLTKLDYFEDIKVNTRRGSTEDMMILDIEVAEKPTGAFSFGAGYSNEDNAFGMASISQRNLFGRGQILELKGTLGGTSSRYNLSFTEPYVWDTLLRGGVDLFNWAYDYDYYDKDSIGGGIRFSYPVFDYTQAGLTYRYERADISNVDVNASDDVKEMKGSNTKSAVTLALSYDSRDQFFNPTQGSDHSITTEFAGLGGSIGFTKLIAETGWYYPIVWKLVGFAHAKGGYIWDTSGKELPDYEKFRIGGINSLRGFDWDDLAPKEINSVGLITEVGGEKYVQFNFEILFPLFSDVGIRGVVFFDTGDVYADGESVDLGNLAQSVGGGIRWYSPVGPIRLEYGHVLDDAGNDVSGGQWEFTMGAAF